MIKKAKIAGCDIILLPECIDFGWTHPSAKTDAKKFLENGVTYYQILHMK